ncbi:hypothetical protein G3545_03410 [Starkeya sp. ORNL1]|uniref:hypothetical protein n=1 Tax=Starkeya sp. ORNL1 TaxID=2709380 RepID=UPI0014629208|nr:hypothetical protein [Starkeya sp. ORNL1]QJP12790.1 hypothetical protein G3545_03410 [Starkeya sp. ORNL1]
MSVRTEQPKPIGMVRAAAIFIGWCLLPLSFVLDGGRSVLVIAAAIAALGVLFGVVTAVLIAATRRRWITARRLALTALLMVGTLYMAERHSTAIRFALARPFYISQVHRHSLQRMRWDWAGGLGWEVSLLYDASGSPPDSKSKDGKGCTLDVRRLDAQFYLDGIFC